MYLGDDGIVHVTLVGEIDEETAVALKEAGIQFGNIIGRKVNSFMDLNRVRKLSPNARKVMKDSCVHKNAGKIALYGIHPVARILASFAMGPTKKEDIRFFKTRDAAFAWLRE